MIFINKIIKKRRPNISISNFRSRITGWKNNLQGLQIWKALLIRGFKPIRDLANPPIVIPDLEGSKWDQISNIDYEYRREEAIDWRRKGSGNKERNRGDSKERFVKALILMILNHALS